MKHNAKLSLLLLAAAACSCSNNPADEPKGNAVSFEVATAPASRTVTNSDNSTVFIAGDRIGIYGSKGAEGFNLPHVVGSDGQLLAEAGAQVFYNPAAGAVADFHAYYPYTPDQTGSTVSFTVGSDQSTADLFNASDFMTAATLNVATGDENPVKLTFSHRLAVVQLEIVAAAGDTPANAVLSGVQPTVEWNMATDAVTTSGEAGDIRMWQRTDDGLTYWAVVPAQTVAAGTRLLSVSLGDESYAFTTVAPVKLGEGMIKKFRISVTEAGEVVVFNPDLDINGWNEDDEIVEGEAETVEPEPLMALEDFSAFNPTAISRNKEEITLPGWYLYHLYDNDVLEITSDGDRDKVMHIRRVVQEGKTALEWHNGAYYYAAANPDKKTYTLRFTARSSFSENMKSNQLRIGAYMKDAQGKDHFVALKKGDDLVSTIYYQVPSVEYATYTLEFDLSKVSTIHNGNAQTDWLEPDADMLSLVTLYISSNAKDVDFWIDDIEWK